MGFDGTTVTPHIRTIIEEFQVGSILLTAKNCKCEESVHRAMRRVYSSMTDLDLKLPNRQQSFVTTCRRLLTMPATQYHWLSALTRRMVVSTVSSMRSTFANTLVTWVCQPQDPRTWPLR